MQRILDVSKMRKLKILLMNDGLQILFNLQMHCIHISN